MNSLTAEEPDNLFLTRRDAALYLLTVAMHAMLAVGLIALLAWPTTR